MKTDTVPPGYKSFSILALGWIGWLWLGLILALAGIFYAVPLVVGLVLAGLACARYGRKAFAKQLRPLAAGSALFAVLVLSVAFLVWRSADPTVFSGRDQGSYSLAALRLAQEHRLDFSTPAAEAFFGIYGPGKALNFPGFAYTGDGRLTTQFPLGYIAWLASGVSLFGLPGLALANAFTVAAFLASFFLLLKLFVPRSYAAAGTLLAAASFPLAWFPKFTLSENLAWALFALLALQLALFLKYGDQLSYAAVLATAGFFAFTRIEGFAFLAVTAAMLAASQEAWRLWKSRPLASAALPALAFLGVLAADLAADLPFYKTVAKALLQTWLPAAAETGAATGVFPESAAPSLAAIFWMYGLLPVFVIGTMSVPILARRRRFLALVPFALALPTFLYFVQPHISADHPWMLRRFAFSLWPALLFSAILGIREVQDFLENRFPSIPFFRNGRYAAALFAILLLVQVPAFLQYAAANENRGLLRQAESLAAGFSSRDLVLVSREATGDAWNMVPDALDALFGLNAAYFFNPEDLSRLDRSRFENVYLVASTAETPHYGPIGDRLVPVRPYVIRTTRLEKSPGQLPREIVSETAGTVFKIQP
jgi:hypothetical protein